MTLLVPELSVRVLVGRVEGLLVWQGTPVVLVEVAQRSVGPVRSSDVVRLA